MPTINKPSRIKNNADHIQRKKRMSIYNTARWRELRRIKLVSDPLCELCKARDIVTVAEDVHHIASFLTDQGINKTLAFDYDNLMSLCKVCHQKVHNDMVYRSVKRESEMLTRNRG